MEQKSEKLLRQKNENKGKNFNFWQDHSHNYLEMAFKTDKRERIESPDGYGKRTGQCGDTIEMFLTINHDDIICSASFDTDGCMNTTACANTVVMMVEGKTVSQAWEIKVDDIIDHLQTLPENEIHCAELAVGSLYLALSNSRVMKNSQWKKLYRKEIF